MTEHGGYPVTLPRDYEYSRKRIIERVETTTKQVAQIVKVAGAAAGREVSGPLKLAISALTAVQQSIDNRARLDRAGIDPENFFSIQLVEDSHQRKAMEELLRSIAERKRLPNITGDLKGITLNDGRTIWVCDQCHNCLQRSVPIKTDTLSLKQYRGLIRREPWVQVTFHNPTSVIVFTSAFARPSNTERITINIDRTYFEAPERTDGTRLKSIIYLFNELGQVLQGQKVLKCLEIRCNAATDGRVYVGLQAVLQCPSLEALHVSRVPCFLDGKSILIKCRKLQELRLHGVLVDTAQAKKNLERLVKLNPDLKKLTVAPGGSSPCLLLDALVSRCNAGVISVDLGD
ncbi:hypothetical protein BGX31_010533 [Mortierella sp. GBA43]|nr:hypothetical protein BGX31_010533 [Mortierella sp. GBA43]